MKYIIKNCPNCYIHNRFICGLTYERSGFKSESESYKLCKDITDCVMKRIVELCKIETKPIQVYYATSDLPFVQTALNRKGADFAVKIIELLEIEEVDE